ncbi:hypothetical protein ACOMHN_060103 [Nucella lapillus]
MMKNDAEAEKRMMEVAQSIANMMARQHAVDDWQRQSETRGQSEGTNEAACSTIVRSQNWNQEVGKPFRSLAEHRETQVTPELAGT